jgi:hypothetical protein
MPQRVQKQITSVNHAIHLTTPELLPGLTVSILTGAGWIDLEALITIGNALATGYSLDLCFVIDGVVPSYDSPLSIHGKAAQYDRTIIAHHAAARLGAGQHTIAYHAWTDATGPEISSYFAHLMVTELGF